MKVRYGFVSNSSSTAFIVIEKGNIEKCVAHINNVIMESDDVLKLSQLYPETEFGWERVKYKTIGDRIAFAYLQATYLGEHYIKMLTKCICDNTNATDVLYDIEGGYIDHQSSALEGENIEMFESEEKLKKFIFSDNSYIQGDNDNWW